MQRKDAANWLWALWTGPQLLLWPSYTIPCGSWFSNANLMVLCPLIYFVDWPIDVESLTTAMCPLRRCVSALQSVMPTSMQC